MTDLVAALGLVLVIEGLLWAAFPGMGAWLLQTMAETPEPAVRISGAVAIAMGVAVVWLVRG